MKTKWHTYRRQWPSPLWESAVDQQRLPNTLRHHPLKYWINPGHAFIPAFIPAVGALQENDPHYKNFRIPPEHPHQDTCSLHLQNANHQMVYGEPSASQTFEKKYANSALQSKPD